MKQMRFIRNFTVEPIELLLKLELAPSNILPRCEFGGFATAEVDVAALEGAPSDELTVLALGLEVTSPDFGHANWNAGAACRRLLVLAREAVKRSRGPLVLNTVLGPLYSLHGGAGVEDRRSVEAEIDAYNLAIRELAASDPARILLADWTLYARQLGEAGTYDRRFWYANGAPFARGFLVRYARDIAAPLRLAAGVVRKCLVLDCDNTLWAGVVGEDGLEGIRLSEDTLPGAYFREFQRSILDLHERGVAIALASKNNETDVMEVLDHHPHMLLKREHLAAWRINWEDKPASLAAIAAELNLGLDALVFVDDNPLECELVARVLPKVQVLKAPEGGELATFLQRCNPFEAMSVTAADRLRNASYQENRERTQLSVDVGDLDAYKREVGTTLTVRRVGVDDLARTEQILQRTNQFNLTTRRYNIAQVKEMLADADVLLLCAELRDRFGDLGLVGISIMRRKGAVAVIDSLLMSCRALGRDAELAFAGALYALIHSEWSSRWIEAEYVASAKNGMVAEFWLRAGLDRISDTGDGVVRFRGAADRPSLATIAPDFVTLVMEL